MLQASVIKTSSSFFFLLECCQNESPPVLTLSDQTEFFLFLIVLSRHANSYTTKNRNSFVFDKNKHLCDGKKKVVIEKILTHF